MLNGKSVVLKIMSRHCYVSGHPIASVVSAAAAAAAAATTTTVI